MRTTKYLLSAFCLTLATIPALAESQSITLSSHCTGDPEWNENNPYGPRMPAAPVICTIDFDSHRIATSIAYEITAYELWDEDGVSPIVSYPSDYDIVEYMSRLAGVFQLRIVTSDRTYAGYLEL